LISAQAPREPTLRVRLISKRSRALSSGTLEAVSFPQLQGEAHAQKDFSRIAAFFSCLVFAGSIALCNRPQTQACTYGAQGCLQLDVKEHNALQLPRTGMAESPASEHEGILRTS
jgi:hypothetical protein